MLERVPPHSNFSHISNDPPSFPKPTGNKDIDKCQNNIITLDTTLSSLYYELKKPTPNAGSIDQYMNTITLTMKTLKEDLPLPPQKSPMEDRELEPHYGQDKVSNMLSAIYGPNVDGTSGLSAGIDKLVSSYGSKDYNGMETSLQNNYHDIETLETQFM